MSSDQIDTLDDTLDQCFDEMENNDLEKELTQDKKDNNNEQEIINNELEQEDDEEEEDVLEITFDELLNAINDRYFKLLKKVNTIMENHETINKSIQYDIEYLKDKLIENPFAVLIFITDNYLYCLEQIKDRNSDFFIYQKEKTIKKNGKTIKNKITRMGNKTSLKVILNNIKRETSLSIFNDIIDIFKLLTYEEDNVYNFHDDYLEFIQENFKLNKNFNKISIVLENIDSIIGSFDDDVLEEEEYAKKMEETQKQNKKNISRNKKKKDDNIGQDFLKGVEDTKIAKMAKQISEKINLDDFPILQDPSKLLSTLTNPEEGMSSIGGLMEVVMKEVQSSFQNNDSNENDLVNEAQNIMGKLSGTGLDPMNLMKNMNLDMNNFADLFNKGAQK